MDKSHFIFHRNLKSFFLTFWEVLKLLSMLFFGLRLSMFFSPVITSLSTFSSVPSWETHSYHGPLGLLWINLSGIFLNDRHKTRENFILVHNEENKLKALGRSNNDNKSTETLYWYCFYPSKCIFWLNCCFKYWLLLSFSFKGIL